MIVGEESATVMATLPPLSNTQRSHNKGGRCSVHRMTQKRHIRQHLRPHELAYILSHWFIGHRLGVWRGTVVPKVESIDRALHITQKSFAQWCEISFRATVRRTQLERETSLGENKRQTTGREGWRAGYRFHCHRVAGMPYNPTLLHFSDSNRTFGGREAASVIL
jgi:hypothetical protein